MLERRERGEPEWLVVFDTLYSDEMRLAFSSVTLPSFCFFQTGMYSFLFLVYTFIVDNDLRVTVCSFHLSLTPGRTDTYFRAVELCSLNAMDLLRLCGNGYSNLLLLHFITSVFYVPESHISRLTVLYFRSLSIFR